MPDAVLHIGTNEGFTGRPGLTGTDDPFQSLPVSEYRYKRLAETRAAALQGKTLPYQMSWNDVVYAYRMVYDKATGMGSRLPTNLMFAYSPGAKLGYSANYGRAQETTDTDVTGKTITLAAGQVVGQTRMQAATGVSTAPLAAGTLDNLVWLMLAHGEPAVAAAPIMYARRTDANNWIRFFRQSTTNVRIEKNVASTTTTERDVTVPSTEPIVGSAYAIRINGTICSVYVNGIQYDSFTLSAGAQGLTGLQVGFDMTAAGRAVMGELEVWSTNAPV